MDNLNGVIETSNISGTVAGSSRVSSGIARSNSVSGSVVDDEIIAGSVASTRALNGVVGVGSGSAPITIDDHLSLTSTNPVQNKVITAAIQGLSEYDVVYSDSTDTYTLNTTSTVSTSIFPYNVPDTGDLVITAGGYLGRVISASNNTFRITWLPPYLSDRLVVQNNVDNTTIGFLPLLMGPSGQTSGTASESYYKSSVGVLLSTGALSAPHFIGDGSGITGLNASHLSSGTVPLERLPSVIREDKYVQQSEIDRELIGQYPVLLTGISNPNGGTYIANYDTRIYVNPFLGKLYGSFSGDGSGLTGVPASSLSGVLPVANGGTGSSTATGAVVNLGLSINGIPKIDSSGNVTKATPEDLAAVGYNVVVYQGNATVVASIGSGVDEVLPIGPLFITTAPPGEAPKVGDCIISANGYIGSIKEIGENNTTATWFNKISSLTGYVTGTKLVLNSN